MRVGLSKMAIFLLILFAISSEPSHLSLLRPQLLYCARYSPLVAPQYISLFRHKDSHIINKTNQHTTNTDILKYYY